MTACLCNNDRVSNSSYFALLFKWRLSFTVFAIKVQKICAIHKLCLCVSVFNLYSNCIKDYSYILHHLCVLFGDSFIFLPFSSRWSTPTLCTWKRHALGSPHRCYDVMSGLGSAVCAKLHQPRLRNTDDRPILCLSIALPPCMTVLWHRQ